MVSDHEGDKGSAKCQIEVSKRICENISDLEEVQPTDTIDVGNDKVYIVSNNTSNSIVRSYFFKTLKRCYESSYRNK